MIFAIRRAERYSPNCVDKDAAILDGVSQLLLREGYDVRTVGEESAWAVGVASAYISMGRKPETLARLALEERRGAVVVNTADSVSLCCNRKRLTERLRLGGVPMPKEEGSFGYWVKRGDGVAETEHDVRYAESAEERDEIEAEMRTAGVKEVVVQAHIKGDLVKFYGVRSTPFFRTFYPGDDKQSKFGDEQRNGSPCHYLFNMEALHDAAEKAAELSGVDVYGGDCIVSQDGEFSIIDFNDWPSFSRCRQEASAAIAKHVIAKLQTQALLGTNRKRNNAKH